MPIIKIPTPLRAYTEGEKDISVEGKTVNAALDSLLSIYPDLKKSIYNEYGQLRAFVNLFLGEEHIRDLEGLDTPLTEKDLLLIIPSIAGGRG
ncbi:MAG: molybdopterin synthase sulfur carrier subunit [Anaerolineae bacterium]|jgi:molybdopterin converting factor small subunit|nr:molybdopterin synthase sulfur carrier subunit [Anaerolineae bacterium]